MLNVNQECYFRRGKETAREMEGLTITMCWIPLHFIYLFAFIYFMCVSISSAFMCVSNTCTPGACSTQKKVSDALELKLGLL